MGLVAASAVLAFASNASAHGQTNRQQSESNCALNQRHSGAVGGVVGAGLGAAAGNAIAASSVSPEGIAVGMLVGAIVGHKVGSNNANCVTEVANETEYSTVTHGRSYGEERYLSNGRAHRVNPVRHAPPMASHNGHREHTRHHHHHQTQTVSSQVEHGQYNEQSREVYVESSAPQGYSGWYEPSRYSYYGQQRYGASAYQQVNQTSGGQVVQQWSYGPTYVPAPQYAPQGMVPNYAPQQYSPVAPQSPASPCGRWVCE